MMTAHQISRSLQRSTDVAERIRDAREELIHATMEALDLDEREACAKLADYFGLIAA